MLEARISLGKLFSLVSTALSRKSIWDGRSMTEERPLCCLFRVFWARGSCHLISLWDPVVLLYEGGEC